MRLDTFRTLLRLRSAGTEEARRVLAQSLAVQSQAEADASAADKRLQIEAEAALDLGASDGAVEAYASWLPLGRQAAKLARARCDLANDQVTVARTALSLARVGERAARTILDKMEADFELTRARKAQAELDDIPGSQRTS